MLKIWKQAWRKDDGSASKSFSAPVGDDLDDLHFSGSESGELQSEDLTNNTLTVQHEGFDPLSSSDKLLKRESAQYEHVRPFKKRKLSNDTNTHPSIISHSSDYPNGKGFGLPAEIKTFVDVVFEQAKKENTIAVLKSDESRTILLSKLLLWSSETERLRPPSTLLRRRRVAVVLLDNASSIEGLASNITHETGLNSGVFEKTKNDVFVSPQWNDLVSKDVILIETDAFFESLVKGSIAISQIRLLIIEDVRPIKDDENHPMIKVMRDFFEVTDSLSRPKIFGMMKCSTESDFYFDLRTLKLERILNAKVFNTSQPKPATPRHSSGKPMEMVVFYDPQFKEIQTPLFQQLRKYDPREQIYKRYFRDARHAIRSLGACASDLVWRRALKDIEANTSAVYEEEDEMQPNSETAIAKAKLNVMNTLKNWGFNMPNLDPSSRGFNVSPKFAKLVQVLKACEPYGDDLRAIIFVHRKIVAEILADMLRMLDDHFKFLRPQALTGHAFRSEEAAQHDVLDAFRTGTYNLLIVTKAAEDMEIHPATTVIRFDLFESFVSYAYCRARANGSNSHIIHMAERGSDLHRRQISQLARMDSRMVNWVEKVCLSSGSAVPPVKLKETTDPYRSDSEDEDGDTSKYINDPTTGGRIYNQDSTTVIYRFVSYIQNPVDGTLVEPLFEYEEFADSLSMSTSYICTVLLPPGSPVAKISGPPCLSRSLARRAACYQTCLVLSQQGLLDYHLFPRASLPTSRRQREGYVSFHVKESLSDSDDDEVFLPAKGKQGPKSTCTRPYPRKAPDFWTNTLPIMRGCLYPTIISPGIELDADKTAEHSPLVLFTRLPLPSMPTSRVFFSGVPGTIDFYRGAAVDMDDDQLILLYRYTLRILRAVTNKPYVCSLENMAYFVAPLPKSWKFVRQNSPWTLPNIKKEIPWDKIELTAKQGAIPLEIQDLSTLEKDIDDAVIQDRWVEFTRRYYCIRMRPDLSPLSRPEDSLREQNYENLLEYCKARRKGFEGLQKADQPLIEVECVPPLVNHLSPSSRPFENRRKIPAKYLIPELCAKFTVPASTFRTALLLPSILRRVDDLLLVKELNAKYFDHSIDEHQLHVALSAPSAGLEFDYERLELLGDAYLKYLSSIYLFVTNPSQREGDLHIARQRIISNQSLLKNADRSGLPQFIQSKPFTAKLWAPPNWHTSRLPRILDEDKSAEHGSLGRAESSELIQDKKKSDSEIDEPSDEIGESAKLDSIEAQGAPEPLPTNIKKKYSSSKASLKFENKKFANDESVQWLGDKAIADVAEAIIGAAFATGGREFALKAAKSLNVPVPHIDQWADFSQKALAPPPDATINLKEGSLQAVEDIIGTKFSRPHLLAQALTHTSVRGNEMTCYERFEFIGDAILDFLVVRHIFDRNETLSPGALTLLKGAMVSNATLAAVCVWSGLHEHLMFDSYNLASSIQLYADQLKAKQVEEYSIAEKEKRLPGQYWLEMEPPKALSDVVESILGAVYVSDDFSADGAESFFNKIMRPFYDKHINLYNLSHHPTKILFELLQSQGCQNFEISKEHVVSDNNEVSAKCEVIVHDIILSSATDSTSTFAARIASLSALDALEGDSSFMARTCDCRTLGQLKKAEKKALKKAARRDVDEIAVEHALIEVDYTQQYLQN